MISPVRIWRPIHIAVRRDSWRPVSYEVVGHWVPTVGGIPDSHFLECGELRRGHRYIHRASHLHGVVGDRWPISRVLRVADGTVVEELDQCPICPLVVGSGDDVGR